MEELSGAIERADLAGRHLATENHRPLSQADETDGGRDRAA